jgi:hypothetical protein
MLPQIALFSAALSVLNNALTNEVRNEESFGAIDPGCNDAACCWSDGSGAAAEENLSDRISIVVRSKCAGKGGPGDQVTSGWSEIRGQLSVRAMRKIL